jgi:hypothetical protein
VRDRYGKAHFDLDLSKSPLRPSWSRLDHSKGYAIGNLRAGIWVTDMAESDGLGDDQAEDEPRYADEEDDDDEGEDEGPAVHACAQPEPATCHGRTEVLMNAIKHLFISRPPKTDLREQADTFWHG